MRKFVTILLLIVSLTLFCGFTQKNDRARVTFTFGSYEITYQDELLSEPDFTVTADFHNRRINAPLKEKIDCVEQSLVSGATAKDAMLYTFPKLSQTVDKIIKAVNCESQNASITFKPYQNPMFKINREKTGYEVVEESLYYETFLALRKSQNPTVSIPTLSKLASVKADDLKKCVNLRARFTTSYETSTENRKHNIRLALSKINGVTIEGGEEFSFNKTVGKRTAQNGYQDAKIIVGGEYVDGVGGGVCQVSTTLYNCALLADLTVLAVQPHSLPPTYIPYSLDAMVNSSGSDLRLKNESELPVFIKAYGNDTTATVEIYGTALPYEIKRESKLISKTATPPDKIVVDEDNKYDTADLQAGESKRVSYSSPGISSESYLCYYKKGKLIEKKRLRSDIYRAKEGVIAVKPSSPSN